MCPPETVVAAVSVGAASALTGQAAIVRLAKRLRDEDEG